MTHKVVSYLLNLAFHSSTSVFQQINKKDIHLCSDKQTRRGIKPKANLFYGVVSEHVVSFLPSVDQTPGQVSGSQHHEFPCLQT